MSRPTRRGVVAVAATVLAIGVVAVIGTAVVYGRSFAPPPERPIRSDALSYYLYLPAALLDHDLSGRATLERDFGGDYRVADLVPKKHGYLDKHPPGEAIPASLQSKAPLHRPWPWLLAELGRIHGEILRTLAAVSPEFTTEARAPLVMVVNVTDDDGKVVPLHWVEELDWKAYAITWRLHVLDHLKQVKKVRAAMDR